jgi:hypothetical protein
MTNTVRGRIFVVETPEEQYDYWLFLEDFNNPDKLLSGVWRGRNPFIQSGKIQWSIVKHDTIAKSISRCSNPVEQIDIVVRREETKNCLWFLNDGSWELLGHLELVHRYHSLIDIRGIRLSSLDDSVSYSIDDFESDNQELVERITTKQDQIRTKSERRIPVEIRLNIEDDDFVIQLDEDDTLVEEIRIRQTEHLIQFLRGPLSGAMRSSEYKGYREFYTWNPYTDIEYGEVSFVRPFVESRRPYSHLQYTLPSNALVLSSLETRTVTLQVKHNESLCPIKSGTAIRHGLCWRVRSDIDNLEFILSDIEIARMYTSREFVMSGIRYFTDFEFTPDPTKRNGFVFRESSPFAEILSLRKLPPSTYLKMTEEKLRCNVMRDRDEIQLTVQSTITGDIVYSWHLVKLKSEIDVDELLNQTRLVLDEIIESYFNGTAGIERFINYSESLDKVRLHVSNFRFS